MSENQLLTDAELAEIQRRRPGSLVSLACEGMYLTPEEHTLVAQMDHEHLGPDARTPRIVAYVLARQKAKNPRPCMMDHPYCYRGTEIYRNKWNIRDKDQLALV